MAGNLWREYVNNPDFFSKKEKGLLDHHFDYYLDLYEEKRPTKSTLEQDFVRLCSTGCPITRHEHVFHKLLVLSGNLEPSRCSLREQNYTPLRDPTFIEQLNTQVSSNNLTDFYVTNKWEYYIKNRHEFSSIEAYVLDLESGYLMAIHDKVLPPPDSSTAQLIQNCKNGFSLNTRELSFLKLLKVADFSREAPNSIKLHISREAPKARQIDPIEHIKNCVKNQSRPLHETTGTPKKPVTLREPQKVTSEEISKIGTSKTTGIHRGPATVNEILGSQDGTPTPILITDIGLDKFGSRQDHKRLRSQNSYEIKNRNQV